MHRSGLTELEVVMAVVRRGSFRGAAQELGMSATAVSNAIAGLESRLGRGFQPHHPQRGAHRRRTALRGAYRPGAGRSASPGRRSQRHREPAGTLRLNVPNHIGTLFSGPAADRLHDPLPENARGNGERSRMIDIVAEGYDAGSASKSPFRRT